MNNAKNCQFNGTSWWLLFVTVAVFLHFICVVCHTLYSFIVYLDVSLHWNCTSVRRCFCQHFPSGLGLSFFSTLRLLSHSLARIYTTLCRFICTCFLYFAFTLIVAPTFFFTLHVQLYRNKYTLRRFGLVFFLLCHSLWMHGNHKSFRTMWNKTRTSI